MRRDCIVKPKVNTEDPVLVQEKKSFIIIADSPNLRMKSYGPTSLLNIQSNKLIDIQIKEISKNFNNYEIILCTGYESDRITRYIKQKHKNLNIRTVENQNYENTNSCESLRLALNNLNNNNVFIMDGNLIFDGKILLNKIKKSYILFETNNKTLEVGVNVNRNGYAEHIGFGASKYWSEIIYLHESNVINNLSRFLSNDKYKKRFVFEAINAIINSRVSITAIENKKSVYKIQGVKYYHEIKGLKK